MFGEAFNRFELRDRVIGNLLTDAAERFGERVFVNMPGGSLRFSEIPERAALAAGSLQALGVGRGDVVATLLNNRIELPAVLWGQAWHGGIGVPVNTAHRSTVLRHILNDCAASVIVAEASKMTDLELISDDLPFVRTVIVAGDEDHPVWTGPEFIRWNDLLESAELVGQSSVSFSDPWLIMYTSGTTGPSKGVVMSHHHHYCYSVPLVDHLGWGPQDHLFTPLPLFHTAAHNTIFLPGLVAGAQVTISERFSASRFWTDVADSGATHALLIGALGNILMRQDASPSDREHQLKTLWCVPPPSDEGFAERFGVELLWQGWGMTEGYPNQLQPNHPAKARNCIGKSTPLFSVQVVDEDDVPVPADATAIGEIIFRPNVPFAMMTEYFKNPDATAAAFRNLWFHTGDLASIDAEGFLYFSGRKKDVIRRRGENVSAFEVEREVLSHPSVMQAAAFGVPSELSEEDVKVDVVLLPGHDATAEDLMVHLEVRLPAIMLPRYIQFREALPMTASERVEKYRLKEEGIAGADFDAGEWTRKAK